MASPAAPAPTLTTATVNPVDSENRSSVCTGNVVSKLGEAGIIMGPVNNPADSVTGMSLAENRGKRAMGVSGITGKSRDEHSAKNRGNRGVGPSGVAESGGDVGTKQPGNKPREKDSAKNRENRGVGPSDVAEYVRGANDVVKQPGNTLPKSWVNIFRGNRVPGKCMKLRKIEVDKSFVEIKDNEVDSIDDS